MADLLALSEHIIDTGDLTQPVNRLSLEFSEVADDIGIVEAFSHVIALRTAEGLVVFDTSNEPFAAGCVAGLRGWSTDRFHSLVYTHGHIDHVSGSGAFVADNQERGHNDPAVIAHENVQPRFDRYRLTDGYNATINERQFGGAIIANDDDPFRFLTSSVALPTTAFEETLQLEVGGVRIDLRHDRGETDDHAWAWIPDRKAIVSGDLATWVFPNAGNPQKVQRYPLEWAGALRSMAELQPELLLPAHGLPVAGRDRIATMLDDIATSLETLVRDVLDLMNQGARLDAILQEVRVAPELMAKPYLQATYDEPEFVIRNIWRLYGGWYNGNPAELKPAPDHVLATEIGNLAGGVDKLVARASELSDAGEHRLACHLVELATQAEPDNADAHAARSEVYRARRKTESSLMSKGIFRWAGKQSEAAAAANMKER